MTALSRWLQRLHRDEGGATAVEFSLLGLTLIIMILGVIQFSLVYITALQLKSALSEAAASANNPQYPQYKVASSVRTFLCGGLTLADSCSSKLDLEQMPVKTMSATRQPITGSTYTFGSTGDLLLIRADVPVVTFVPFVPKLDVSASAVWLNR